MRKLVSVMVEDVSSLKVSGEYNACSRNIAHHDFVS